MQTDTEFTWILMAFVLLVAFMNHSAIGEVNLLWGLGMLVQIPLKVAIALMNSFPLLAPLFILGTMYYIRIVIPAAGGEGIYVFVLGALMVLILGI